MQSFKQMGISFLKEKSEAFDQLMKNKQREQAKETPMWKDTLGNVGGLLVKVNTTAGLDEIVKAHITKTVRRLSEVMPRLNEDFSDVEYTLKLNTLASAFIEQVEAYLAITPSHARDQQNDEMIAFLSGVQEIINKTGAILDDGAVEKFQEGSVMLEALKEDGAV